jgi:O-antigen/teichoic acid export membrane protein
VLSVESYGTLEMLTTLGNSALMLASLGLPSALNKCYHRDCRDEDDRRRLIGTMTWLLLPAAIATLAIGLLGGRPIATLLLHDPGAGDLVALSLASSAFFTLSQIPLSLLRAREMSLSYSLLSFWQFLVMAGLNILLVGRWGLGVKGVLLGSTGASIIVVLTSVPLLLRHGSLRYSGRLARLLMAFGLPMIPVSISAWVMNLSDRWLLGFLSDAHQLGLYGLGYRYGMLVEMLLVLPFQMAWPAFYFRESSRPDARAVYARVTTWYAVVGGFITVAVALAGEIVLRLMAERSFWGGSDIIPLVAAAYFFNGFQFCVAPGVHLGGKTHLLPGIAMLSAAVNVVLNLLWIQRFGMMGAAWATLLSFIVLFVLTAWVSRRAYGFQFESRRLGTALAAMALMLAVAQGLRIESTPLDLAVRGALLLLAAAGATFWCCRELDLRWNTVVNQTFGRLKASRPA